MFLILFISLCTYKILPHSGARGGINYWPTDVRCLEFIPSIIAYLLIIVFSFTICKDSKTVKLFYFTKPYEKYLFWCTVGFLVINVVCSALYYALFWMNFPNNGSFDDVDISDIFVACAISPIVLLISVISNKRMNLGLYCVAFVSLSIGTYYVSMAQNWDTQVRHFFYIDRIITHVTALLGLGCMVFQHYYFKK